MTSGGIPVLLSGEGTNVLTGTAGGATIFTVTLNDGGTYTLDMVGTLDSPAQFNVGALGDLGISGGNGALFIVGSGTAGTSEDDILISSVQPGGTINTSNADIGTDNQWIDPNKGVKFEFVENIDVNGGYENTRTLTGAQVQLATVKGGATQTNVLIALYAAEENIIEDLTEFNAVVTSINYTSGGVEISLDSPSEIAQALSDGDIQIALNYDVGGNLVSGIVVNNVDEGTSVGITANTGFDTVDIVNYEGPDFSVNGISGAYITNAPVSFDASFTATDGDGDVTTVDTFTMSLNPVIDGSDQADSLTGSAADELLRGFEGNDILVGGEGDDILFGGEGDDTLSGGLGNDSFVFSAEAGEGILNTINDFVSGDPDNDPNADTLSFADLLDPENDLESFTDDIGVVINGNDLELHIPDQSANNVDTVVTLSGLGTEYSGYNGHHLTDIINDTLDLGVDTINTDTYAT
jgi:Ca2+-binding RTX toxin-like protein